MRLTTLTVSCAGAPRGLTAVGGDAPGCSTWAWAESTALEIIASKASDNFDTPTLVELWRTAPYLHDDAAATVRDIVTNRNPHERHGKTSKLSRRQLEDLCAYLLSL